MKQENFFYQDEYYSTIDDFMDELFSNDKEHVATLADNKEFVCNTSKLSPIWQFDADSITESIDDERFSERNVDDEFRSISKILSDNIDFENINSLIPKLYYPSKETFVITKKDLLDWFN